jgi:hypothetical protein
MKNLFNDISQGEKNRILEMHSNKKNLIKESPDSNEMHNKAMSLLKSELADSGITTPIKELIGDIDPLCRVPETGNSEHDSILSKIWEWASEQSVESLKKMKSMIKNAIFKSKDKRVDEQAEPLFFIGSAPVTAPLLMIIGGIILLIIVAVIIKKSFFPSYSCNRSKYSWKY